MKKRNIYEQIFRTKQMMGLITENVDMRAYDKVLDLYNEVGIEGMTEDEVNYLKSGGESEVPERFKEVREKKIPASEFFNEKPRPGEENRDDELIGF
jgi:hypothetical protein